MSATVVEVHKGVRRVGAGFYADHAVVCCGFFDFMTCGVFEPKYMYQYTVQYDRDDVLERTTHTYMRRAPARAPPSSSAAPEAAAEAPQAPSTTAGDCVDTSAVKVNDATDAKRPPDATTPVTTTLL